ncbi:phosphatase PAP2 family protein [Roseibacillus ishigakijimensis]|uniref:Phosphatase PAP2 family protein n=1 Tax=Roseibacillus ishigakijimensis TaxID=454146 RepID=A0A934RMX7_9BACT|nr:phosphatase PAP2 family protein [Roseibacillus ishigakijimensis]MBK1834344.1 phosphatase PAP2 family protein [Roseibacillus ishigakijimensis]
MSEFLLDWKAAWRDFAWSWRTGAKRGLGGLLLWVVLTWLTLGWFDESLLLALQGRSGADLNLPRVVDPDQEKWLELCKWLHDYTQFHWFNLLGALFLILVGLWRSKPHWRRAGLAFLLAGGMAGLSVQTMKTLPGRPRPSTVVKKEEATSAFDFRGPNFKGGWRGYPSGHSASAWGSALVLGLYFRRLLIPAIAFSLLIAWSRVYGNYHWPTDALHGSAIGIFFAWLWSRFPPESPATRQQ